MGTNVGEVALVTALGSVTCTSATLKGTVVANATASGSKGEVTSATFTGTGTNGECTSWNGGVTVDANPATNGLPWCLEETEAAEVGRKRGGSCSSASRPIRFILTFTNIGACTYQRNTAAASTITTDEGASATDAIVHLTEQEWTKFEGGALCPSSGKIKMSWTLKTESGEPLYFSS